jgi:WD40 repeat protein
MPARSVLMLSVAYLFVFGSFARCEAPAARGAKSPKEEQANRTDFEGDLLPAGAIGRLGTVRYRGHDNPVVSLAYSPDGASLASGYEGDGKGTDGKVHVWDLATRKPRHVFPGHFPHVLSLAFSPDGKILASGEEAWESSIRLWDLGCGRLTREFFAHLNGVQSLAFSPDGKTLASAGKDARVRLWDVASGERLRQIRVSDSQFKAVTFSPDGKTLLVAGTKGELSLWQADSGQKVRDLGGAGDRNRAVVYAAFLPDGKTILSREFGSARGPINEVRFWDAQSGRLLRSFPMNDSYPFGMRYALSPDGKTLATSGHEGRKPVIHLWDTDSGKQFVWLHEHPGERVPVLAFSPDGKFLASGGGDTTVLLWDIGRARLEHLWAELVAAEGDSARTIKGLAAKPEKAVPFLKERLRRAAEMEVRASDLIADLDSDRFQVREKASRELEKLGPDASFALRAALRGNPSNEVRRRIQALLDGMKNPGGEPAGWDPRRVWLSLAFLEEVGTPEARQVLEELAKGPASSSVAREARAVLERRAKRPKSR